MQSCSAAAAARGRWLAVAATLAAVAATTLGCGGGGTDRAREARTTRSASTITDGSWGAPNANLTNTRKVTGPIDAASVGRLRVAWSMPLPTLFTATPIVSGGVVYAQDMTSNVYAIDLTSGTLNWKTVYEDADNGPNGVSVGDGRVYGATTRRVFALDAATGRQLWARTLTRRQGELIDMAPGFARGSVYVSTVPAEGGVVSTLYSLDAATGRTRWSWGQVPASLWGRPEVNGGGGMWHAPALDGHGGLYASIANPVPWPGTKRYPWGRSRPGPNKWDNSIVKLDERTGRFVWGTQVLPHDVYDWDLQDPVILARSGGRAVALTAGKMGFVYAFDAGSGAMLWKRSVGLHNGHDGDDVRALHGDYSHFRLGQRILPGDWGGVQTPMASDGRTVFVPVNNLWAIYHGQELPHQQDPLEGTGELEAIDIATGRVRWDRKLPHGDYGAASISGDVVFTTTYDGTVWALSTRSGKPLWRARLPAGNDAPLAIAGDTLVVGAGVALSKRARPALVAYRLDAGAASDGS
jgi:outer membrane protein assembly factor BamB